EWTGLSRPRAALARKHEASVTLIWRDSDEQMKRFAAELARQGLKIVPGARFWHILDTSCGKDVAVHWLVEQYRLHDGF
ncbi:mannosyl-3-phosphoglycerate phosphatase-related protein, partial [Klebsiella pneumoniae]|nr:mannosyl-3-phosphoglycerate phosphatase-related protein [Klebsiella pneumoniae]